MFPFKKTENLTIPKHVAIILDGNGRWAKKRGMPRTFGHQVGIENIRRIAIEANRLGIRALSVFAFSTENWNRPQAEVDFLMTLPAQFDAKFKDDFVKHDIKVMFSGRKTKLTPENNEILERITRESINRQGLVLNICFDYGSYYELVEAVKAISTDVLAGTLTIADIEPKTIESHLFTKELPPLDLLIRTSGEIRLSNFFLWQVAYAELWFPKVHWPAFHEKDLMQAIRVFNKRDRRFGAIKKG